MTEPLYHLHMGELIVSPKPVIISTILGSCVSVCLFSKKAGMGGVIHYALPEAPLQSLVKDGFRYGNIAIVSLIEELQCITEDDPSSFSAKIVGGAAEIAGGPLSNIQAGPGNIEIARQILSHYGIPIVGEAVGGSEGRKILFHTKTGRLQMAKIQKQSLEVGLPTKMNGIKKAVDAKSDVAAKNSQRKVLIVDDSKVIRDLLRRILEQDAQLKIIGLAADAFEAAEMVKKERPDVITLDIHMPKMTGVEWLEKFMPYEPIPVVMISSLQMQEGNEVFRALELGAIDYVQKPSLSELAVIGPVIREKVKAASFGKVIRYTARKVSPMVSTDVDVRAVLAIGASTGGTEALKDVICALPEVIPPTVIVQHIPPIFSKAFADRLNHLCKFEVKEAEDGDELKTSRVLIAPGGKQMKIVRRNQGLFIQVTDDAPVNRHKPSVDYLFDSVAALIGPKAVGVILTGMGADGAKGLLTMRNKGARTIGQDEESCVVYGMPRAAFELGAVEKVVPLSEIPKLILKFLEKKKTAA